MTVGLEGLPELLAQFAGVEAGMLDLRQLGAWKGVASEFRKVERELFASEGASGRSGKWKALKPKYAAQKRKRWGDKGILQASGAMFRSLTSEGGDHVFRESAQEMVIGTRDAKAGYHYRGNRNLPQRKPIDPTPEQERQMLQPVRDKLIQLVGNAKLRKLRGF